MCVLSSSSAAVPKLFVPLYPLGIFIDSRVSLKIKVKKFHNSEKMNGLLHLQTCDGPYIYI